MFRKNFVFFRMISIFLRNFRFIFSLYFFAKFSHHFFRIFSRNKLKRIFAFFESERNAKTKQNGRKIFFFAKRFFSFRWKPYLRVFGSSQILPQDILWTTLPNFRRNNQFLRKMLNFRETIFLLDRDNSTFKALKKRIKHHSNKTKDWRCIVRTNFKK